MEAIFLYVTKFKVTTDSKHNKSIAPNLLKREFTVSKPDLYYVGDITYVSTQEGWLCLAVVIDLFSRKVVGWSMNNRKKDQGLVSVKDQWVKFHYPNG